MEYFYSFLGGILAGVLNTLASSGSAVTLPLLVMLGLHPTQANATNRIGVMLGALSAVVVFRQKGLLDWKHDLPLAGVVGAGAVAGAIAWQPAACSGPAGPPRSLPAKTAKSGSTACWSP